MAVWICRDCTAAYAVGAARCPQCGSTDHADENEQNQAEEEDRGMPKITVHGGPSIAGITAGWDDTDNEETTEGGERTSPDPEAGTASSTSDEKQSTTPETTESDSGKPARTTANRSSKARTEGSTARSTAGEKTAPTSDDDKD